MLNFMNDYSEGAHPDVLKRLVETNMEQLTGYGTDKYTASAREKIRIAMGKPQAEIYFLTGGTQTNQLVIDAMTARYEGVISVKTGHVNVHEAGAIEYSGHKVLALPDHEGKMDAGELRQYLKNFYGDENFEHMVFPGIVYLSHPTEYGTLYMKQELQKIKEVCKEYKIPLFIDGARLGYGLAADHTDVSLADIAELADVFYIGGTKLGALCGEAVVFPDGNAPKHVMTQIKMHGALLAKGRLNGIQFDALFTDDLYTNIAGNAIRRAMEIKEILKELGYQMYLDSPTNQQFVIIENEKLEKLGAQVMYGYMEPYDDDHTVIRFCTSWATTREDVEKLREVLQSL